VRSQPACEALLVFKEWPDTGHTRISQPIRLTLCEQGMCVCGSTHAAVAVLLVLASNAAADQIEFRTGAKLRAVASSREIDKQVKIETSVGGRTYTRTVPLDRLSVHHVVESNASAQHECRRRIAAARSVWSAVAASATPVRQRRAA